MYNNPRMSEQAGMRAGLIGAAGVAALTVLSILLGGPAPNLGRLGGGLVLVAYVGIGVLAAFFLTAPRTGRAGARAGAIAGLIGGVAGAIVWVVAALARVTQVRWEGMLPVIGLDVATGIPAAAIGGLCGLSSLVIGVVLGAVGGAVSGAAKHG